jgi:hypothetical protein
MAPDTSTDVSVSFDPSNYPTGVSNNWYAPGDSVTIRLQGDMVTDGNQDIYDVVIWENPADCWDPYDQRIEDFDNVKLDDNGEATIVFEGADTDSIDDGFYDVEILDKDYLESNGVVTDCHTIGDPDFWIRLYHIEVFTDRNGYVPGDMVDVFYNVFNIRDGSPGDSIATDMRGEWEFVSSDGKSDDAGSFTDASGVIELQIDNQGDPTGTYLLYIWVNGTSDGGDREISGQPYLLFINVDSLSLSAFCSDLTGGNVIEGDTMAVIVSTTSGGASAEPGIEVEIQILDGTGASATQISGYGGNFVSDINGNVVYVFTLGAQFTVGNTYTCKAIGDHPQSPQSDSDEDTFDVESDRGVISVNAVFDKGQYMSGDSMSVTVNAAAPMGHAAPNTYSMMVYPGMCGMPGNVLHLAVQATNAFTWNIPNDFTGWMCFSFEVYNADGDFGTDQQSFSIAYGYLVVNASPEEYSEGNTITVTYSLESNVMTSPSYTYRVLDAGGSVVEAGEASGGQFTYVVPSVASTKYTFFVIANQNGRAVTGTDEADLITGFFLSITFDREIYSAGDTMKITYEVKKRGDLELPEVFRFSYSLAGGIADDYQSTSSSGEFTYKIPSGMNEGTFLFSASESSTNTAASEEITMRGGNPLWWAKLAEIPAFDIILLILIIILFIMLWRMRGRGAAARAPEEEAMAPEGEAAPPPPPPAGTTSMEEASAGPSAMSVPCKSCGTGIELTTSKRPIEVMCPSCGETQMVY